MIVKMIFIRLWTDFLHLFNIRHIFFGSAFRGQWSDGGKFIWKTNDWLAGKKSSSKNKIVSQNLKKSFMLEFSSKLCRIALFCNYEGHKSKAEIELPIFRVIVINQTIAIAIIIIIKVVVVVAVAVAVVIIINIPFLLSDSESIPVFVQSE